MNHDDIDRACDLASAGAGGWPLTVADTLALIALQLDRIAAALEADR